MNLQEALDGIEFARGESEGIISWLLLQVCKCISELWQHRSYGNDMLSEWKTHPDIPTAQELLARLVVLLHNPLAREQLATQILTVSTSGPCAYASHICLLRKGAVTFRRFSRSSETSHTEEGTTQFLPKLKF
ncbi:hypothetical protein PIB30_086393 [Stylosanthes scabra]|uniref:Uncharacterized protein n=1 Tax=Stylosanthes scabra TaxID=79078 RepID=A0ABU6YUG7_9FABA|nr:hypothetical protein [Stylosanthes scabra]